MPSSIRPGDGKRSAVCPLPLTGFNGADDYVDSLLSFITSSDLFQRLCGGIHILDFLTKDPDLYTTILPVEWRDWFRRHDVSDILDLLMRENVHDFDFSGRAFSNHSPDQKGVDHLLWRGGPMPPDGLLQYIQCVRTHALNRNFHDHGRDRNKTSTTKTTPLARHVVTGMKPKKIHEVQNFAEYINDLAADVDESSSHNISHIVDFGSGQNYLGRALASPPYDKRVIALESKPLNISGAKNMDVTAKLAEKEKIMRNKKQYRQGLLDREKQSPVIELSRIDDPAEVGSDCSDPESQKRDQTATQEGKGSIQYIETFIESGDLSKIKDNIQCVRDPQLMVVSLHSCGNLLHHGLRSLVLNPQVKAVAMVGCCYNLVTERLGPPTYKLPSLRSCNRRLDETSNAFDPHGFPMSDRFETYPHTHSEGKGIRFNITARMMSVQAPENWTATECDSFFTRHFYRALLQRILVDLGIADKPTESDATDVSPRGWTGPGAPLTIGSLRKACYTSFLAYVRGATAKLGDDPQRGAEISRRMQKLTDGEILQYEERYQAKRKELSIIWSLMAFSASVVESAIVVDRWLYLTERTEVEHCWVETIFDYKQSPRNLVVVGIKKRYCSPIHTLLVGKEEHVFHAQRDVLFVSPVFTRLLNDKVSEDSQTKLHLLEDPAPAFRIILDYLYSGDCSVVDIAGLEAKNSTTDSKSTLLADLKAEHSTDSISTLLAEVYVLAEKYRLPELKVAILDQIKQFVDFAKNSSTLLQMSRIFQMSRIIYKKIPDSDSCFRSYFQTEYVYIVSSQDFSKAILDDLAKGLSTGNNSTARDVCPAYMTWMRLASKASKAEIIDLRKSLRETGDWKLSLKDYLNSPWEDFECSMPVSNGTTFERA